MTQPRKKKILIVDDDLAFRVGTTAMLEDQGYTTGSAVSGEEALRIVSETRYDLVLSDLVMPGINGIELVSGIHKIQPDLPIIMVTGFASVSTAVEAMRRGAYDYVTKPSDNDEMLIKIQRALEEQDKERELINLREEVHEIYTFSNIVSRNSKMKQVFRLVEKVAGTDVAVLILGETGTGKELVAKAIHYNSARRDKPFVVVNCSALAETLLESELFGHEKGAFTGANQQHIGKFEAAEGGSIFLDEIGDVPLTVQTKLLRVLQENEIQRVGGRETIKVDIRVITATNRNLEGMMAAGLFREDFYYRLNVFPIVMPPLRDRLDDLPGLVDHFLKKHSAISQNRVKTMSPDLYPAMMNYPWKGNIRELENLLKRAIINTTGDTITSIELLTPANPDRQAPPPTEADLGSNVPFKEYLSTITRHAEETYLLRMLRVYKGNIIQIAKLMDLDRKTIYRKMAEYSIDPATFRE